MTVRPKVPVELLLPKKRSLEAEVCSPAQLLDLPVHQLEALLLFGDAPDISLAVTLLIADPSTMRAAPSRRHLLVRRLVSQHRPLAHAATSNQKQLDYIHIGVSGRSPEQAEEARNAKGAGGHRAFFAGVYTRLVAYIRFSSCPKEVWLSRGRGVGMS